MFYVLFLAHWVICKLKNQCIKVKTPLSFTTIITTQERKKKNCFSFLTILWFSEQRGEETAKREVGLTSRWAKAFSDQPFIPVLLSVPITFSTKCVEHECCVKVTVSDKKQKWLCGLGLVWFFPPSLSQTTVSAFCQKWHSWVTKMMVPQKGSCTISLGKAAPASASPLPATVTNPVPSLSNTDLTVCKAVLETGHWNTLD